MRKLATYFAAALLAGATSTLSNAANIEKAEAIDGSTYAIVPAAINYIANSASFIRFFNGGLGTATISMTIVNPSTGANVGSVANISVPARAAKIMDMRTLLGSSYANAGVADGGAYVLYLKSSEPLAGYQHLLFNGNNFLFENNSSCANLLNTSTMASDNSIALLGATTNNLATGSVNYPSSIIVHNYSTVSATYNLSVYDANTGEGEGSYSLTVPANNSRSLPFFNSSAVANSLQTLIGWGTTSSQLYASVIITDASGAVPQASAAIVYNNVGLGGSFNMTTACAINAPVTAALSTTAATTFDGALAGSSSASGTFSVIVPAVSTTTVATTGTARIGSTTVALTGTYDPVSRKLVSSGSGYTFTGGVMGGSTFAGSYTGPSSASGGFSSEKKSATTVSRGYCGTFSGTAEGSPISGVFNFVVSGTNALGGVIALPDGSTIRLTGTANGTAVTGYVTGPESAATFTGTIGATSGSGTFTGGDASGTWTGTSCGTF